MKKITLFLASSAELKPEREQFEIEIYRKCKAWFDRDIFLHLDVWEDLSARMAAEGLPQVNRLPPSRNFPYLPLCVSFATWRLCVSCSLLRKAVYDPPNAVLSQLDIKIDKNAQPHFGQSQVS